MNIQIFFNSILFFTLMAVSFYQNIKAAPISCGNEANCTVTADSEICLLEEIGDDACIRKYPSKCHMDIEACKQGKNFTDYSDIYCSMDGYICEQGYERWTIFFGYENISE